MSTPQKNQEVCEGRLKYQIVLSLRFFMTIHDHSNHTLPKMHYRNKPLTVFAKRLNYVKSVLKKNFFWPVFYCIRIEYRKMRTRKNFAFGHFSRSAYLRWLAVLILVLISGLSKTYFCFTIKTILLDRYLKIVSLTWCILSWQPFCQNISNEKILAKGDIWDNYNFNTNHNS